MKFAKKFQTKSEYEAYINGPDAKLPNVSYVLSPSSAEFKNYSGLTIDNLTWVKDVSWSGGTATKNNCTYTVTLHKYDGTSIDVTNETKVSGSLTVPATSSTTRQSIGLLNLTFEYFKYTKTESIEAFQEADNALKRIFFSAYNWDTDVNYTGGTADKTNCSYTLMGEYVDMSQVDITTAATITSNTITVPATSTYDRTSIGTISINATISGFSETVSVTAYQEGDTIPRSITLSGLTWVNNIPWTGGTADKTKCTYTVYGQYIDRTLNITSAATMSGEIIVPETALYERHSIGNLTIEAELSGLTSSGSVEGLQEGVTLTTLNFSGVTWKMDNITNFISYKGGTLDKTDTNYTIYAVYANSTTVDVTSAATVELTGRISAATTTKYEIEYLGEAHIIASYSGKTYNSTALHTYQDPLPSVKFSNRTSGGMSVRFEGADLLQYSTDTGKTWTLLSSATKTISLSNGGRVWFRGAAYTTSLSTYKFRVTGSTGSLEIYGNVMGLLGSAYTEQAMATSGFTYLFEGCTALGYVEPGFFKYATTTAPACYAGMFNGCNYLVNGPTLLPAATVAERAYQYMFKDCHLLRQPPQIAAETLDNYCMMGMFQGCLYFSDLSSYKLPNVAEYMSHYNMFSGCTALTSAPELPATNIVAYCYSNMFNGCHSLVKAPELPASKIQQSAYEYMFADCYSLRTAPDMSNVTNVDSYACQYMFKNCTSLVNAPELPATTFNGSGVYLNMFENCTALVDAPELPATVLTYQCYQNMFKDCSLLVKAPALPASTLAESSYRYMFYNCVKLNEIHCDATNISANNCTDGWLNYVQNTSGDFYGKLVANWPTGVSGILSNWTQHLS